MHRTLLIRAHAARAAIAAGVLRGAPLVELLGAIPVGDRDEWVDVALGIEEAPPDEPDLPRGAVPYLPCGLDEILAMVRDVPLTAEDELVDLGSGLGRVPILAHLLTGARAHGVEVQEPLVRRARALCKSLGLADVTFVQANAAETALDGTIFFLYAPFNGPMLARVLERIEEVARRRPIVVCAVGLEFREVPWLAARKTANVSLTLYDSCAVGDDTPANHG